MAKANPAKISGEETPAEDKQSQPRIEYYGEGAKDVKFEIDPKATLIRVYGNGVVMTDY